MRFFNKFTSGFVAFVFAAMTVCPANVASAQSISQILPQGSMVLSNKIFQPVYLEGLKLNPNSPLSFEFVINSGDQSFDQNNFNSEAAKMVKYFMAALSVPESELWVNLSPYEKDRIIAETVEGTDIGKDFLVLDYLLKQLSASLMSPENETGKKFWDRLYKEAYEHYGVTNIPSSSFHKIWIVPQTASILEHQGIVYVTDAKLDVMLEQDYVAAMNDHGITREDMPQSAMEQDVQKLSSQLMKELVIPAVRREINESEAFASLRQIYRAVILASWFKQNVSSGVLNRVFVNQHKIAGIETESTDAKNTVYKSYVDLFNKGAYQGIQEEYDPQTNQMVSRQYFTGGINETEVARAMMVENDPAQYVEHLTKEIAAGRIGTIKADALPVGVDFAQMTDFVPEEGTLKGVNYRKIASNTYDVTPEIKGLQYETSQYVDSVLAFATAKVNETGEIVILKDSRAASALEYFLRGEKSAYVEAEDFEGFVNRDLSLNSLGFIERRILGAKNLTEAEKVFQLEFSLKGQPDRYVLTIGRTADNETVFRVIPKKTVMIYGFGTIASKVAFGLSALGYQIIAANRSANERARTAVEHGFRVVPLNASGVAAYTKEGFGIVKNSQGEDATADDYLKGDSSLPKIDLIVEGLDGKPMAVVDAKGVPQLDASGKVLTKLPSDIPEGWKVAAITTSLLYKHEVFDKYPQIPVMYQGSNKPKLVSKGVVAETGTLEQAGLDASNFVDAPDVFMPSCNTTAQLTVLGPLFANQNIEPGTVTIDTYTTRRTADPGSIKNEVGADGFAKIEKNYHHAEDVLSFLQQQFEGLDGQPMTGNLKKALNPNAGKEFSFTTDATLGPQTKFHIGRAQITAYKKDGKLLTAAEYKQMLKNNPRLALISTDPAGKQFNPTIVFDALMNRIEKTQAFIVPTYVYDAPEGIGIIFLTPQESNVIPNNVSGALLMTRVVGKAQVPLANQLANLTFDLDKIKARFEQYLPATDAAMVAKTPEDVVQTNTGGIDLNSKIIGDIKSNGDGSVAKSLADIPSLKVDDVAGVVIEMGQPVKVTSPLQIGLGESQKPAQEDPQALSFYDIVFDRVEQYV